MVKIQKTSMWIVGGILMSRGGLIGIFEGVTKNQKTLMGVAAATKYFVDRWEYLDV